MPRVIHFEVSVDQPDRALKFYTDVFGWKIEKWEGPEDYWLVTTGPKEEMGIDGAFMRRDERGWRTVNTISVPSVDEAAEKVKQAGGKLLSERMTIPGVGYFHYCEDTEGNPFGILQGDTAAK
jgi:predicted enzyme related to lactoylglutathione lyase